MLVPLAAGTVALLVVAVATGGYLGE